MCDRRTLIPALFNPRSLCRRAPRRAVRPSETVRPLRPAAQGVAAPLSFITRRRFGPVPGALPLRRGQEEVSTSFWTRGYRRARKLEAIDFAAFESLNAEDRARQLLPLKGEAAGGRRGKSAVSQQSLPPPSPAATPPPLGGGSWGRRLTVASKSARLKSHGETMGRSAVSAPGRMANLDPRTASEALTCIAYSGSSGAVRSAGSKL